jgi:copper chaperone CopZ
METLKFKTTIQCSGCVAKVAPFLNQAVGEGNWEVDYNNSAKVLTVSGTNDKRKVIEAVEMARYQAVPL